MKRIAVIALMMLLLPVCASARGAEPSDSTDVVSEGDKSVIEPPDSATSVGTPHGLGIKLTPVEIDRDKPTQPVLHYYDKHGEPLETPVRFLAELDTVKNVMSGPKYPLFSGVTVGVNFFDALMMIFGQKRANFNLAASCSLWNWVFPTVEAGVGFSNSHPDEGRTYFKVKPSAFVKFGFDYNFLYKSTPDYKVMAGVRFCYSGFSYDIPVISPGSRYYTSADITGVYGLTARCWYAEFLGAIEVKIYKGFSMGWSFRYDVNMKNRYSDPDYPAWFIPGRNGSTAIAATFSAIWRFGSPKPADETKILEKLNK